MPRKRTAQPSTIRYVRLPREGEMFGTVVQLLGHDKVKVKCADGIVRICRIPGRMRKRTWIRNNDVVLVVPWDFQYETRGDIVWRYTRGQVAWLERKGHLKM